MIQTLKAWLMALRDFLFHLDAKQVRTLWVSLVLMVVTLVVVILGQSPAGQAMTHALEEALKTYSGSPLVFVVVGLVFCLAALIGAPQFLLIAATVVAFGPVQGFVLSWIATVVSAAFTYGLGQILGPRAFLLFGIDYQALLPDSLGKNAFVASFLIRNIPSAPFVVVNMAFGLSRAPLGSFLAGCALGIVPKTALVALFSSSYAALSKGQGWQTALLLLVLSGLWLLVVLGVRKFIKSKIKT